MHETAVDYIRSKGWPFKQQAGQLVVERCPFCGDEKHHFYMDPDQGLFFCHKCNEKGNLKTLKKHTGDLQDAIRPAFKKKPSKTPNQNQADAYHKALLNDSKVQEYLTGRCITIETAKRFKLGIYENKGTRWLSIPHFRNGALANVKFRSLPPAEKTFQRVPGCASVLFNGDVLAGSRDVYIAEGELDAITLIQAGIEHVVSGTTGAGSFDAEWLDEIKGAERIFLCYDADEKGQEGARSLAKRLGYTRCFNVELPQGKDINDFFRDHDIFDFQGLVKDARPFDLPGVISVSTAIEILKKAPKGDQGLLTPWHNVNRLVKGFHPGDLIILSAFPKTGKTSWALDVARYMALGKIPVLVYCLEMRPERLVKKVIQAQYRKEELTAADIEQAERELSELSLYLAHAFKKEKLEDVLGLIREAVKRYDLRFVIFDNIHFLIRSVSNVNEELGQAVQGFKLLAEEMEIPMLVIAQPRKRDTGNRDQIMSAEDIKYSNAVHADCDQMIILHRKRIASRSHEIDRGEFVAKAEALDPVTLVRVEAHRYGSGGETLLYFHGEYSRFDSLEETARL